MDEWRRRGDKPVTKFVLRMNKIFTFIAIAIAMLALASCTETDELTGPQQQVATYVPVSFCLSTDALQTGYTDASLSAATKAATDESGMTDIRNVWVIQLDENDKLIGVPKYITDITVSESSASINLDAVATGNSRFLLLANTFKENLSLGIGMSLEAIRQLTIDVKTEADCLAQEGDKTYFRMNGFTERTEIVPSATLSCKLQRNVAKITCHLSVPAGGDLTLRSVQLCNIPNHLNYCPDDTQEREWPAMKTFQPINYDTVVVADAPASYSFSAYMPCNKRGTVADCPDSRQKNRYAPSAATYLQVEATSTDGTPRTYRFYLGTDMVNDFNICPNISYTYTLSLTGKEDPQFDSRVEATALVDYTQPDCERANCYLLNPSTVTEEVRRFIIPIDRINAFWGNPIYQNGEVRTENMIMDDQWECAILWHDMTDLTGLTVEKCTLTDNQHNGRRGFMVTVPQGAEGNVVVTVKKARGTNILWSWHLWITDYQPDKVVSGVAQPGVYRYPVPGGEVHRYIGSAWDGIYKEKFIMDRNLGARSARPEDYNSSGPGILYYQFGRKDPFPLKDSAKQPGGDTYTVAKQASGTMQESIYASCSIFYNGDTHWLSAVPETNIYKQIEYDWQDPCTVQSGQKSIFDPSPMGWKVPDKETWRDFRWDNGNKSGTFNINSEEWTVTQRGIYSVGNEKVAWYPACGSFTAPADSYGRAWSCISYSTDPHAYYLGFSNNGQVNPAYGTSRSLGFPVRCIQE